MEFERRKRSHAHIDIAPLVDVVFLLLLFFMLTYQIAAESSVKIRLPESQTAADEKKDESELVIAVTRELGIYIDDQRVDTASLQEVIRQKLTGDRTPSVKIRADQDVSVGLLIKVADEVKAAGCSAFSIVTQRKEG